jgi:hypothetical protein
MSKFDWILEGIKAWAILTSHVEPCDPRCMGAQGPACECKCDGANHGRAR